MDQGGWDRETSPYHRGEAELHARLGRKDRQESMGRRIHRPYMPDQHRAFFAQLPFLVVGSVDREQRPWASMLFGRPGFVRSPHDRALVLGSAPLPGDPLGSNLEAGAPVGLLGIELPTRRRNRLNGVVGAHRDDGVEVSVVQSFGNCPQYIQTRAMQFVRDPAALVEMEVERFDAIGPRLAAVITGADTFFVASVNPTDDPTDTGGADVNHRGGRPGFIKVEGDTLTIPDYPGNFAFNTLGNFLIHPRAGLLFVDFDSGDLWQLTGRAEVLWDAEVAIAAIAGFRGAERAWRFHLEQGLRIVGGSPLRFGRPGLSPNSRLTGTWAEAERTVAAEEKGRAWRPFRVAEVTDESASIRSFFLEPADGDGLPSHAPGQYLTVEVPLAAGPVVRTYTLSSAPSDARYRISVKREPGADGPPGRASSFLHDHVSVGDRLRARMPAGGFTLDVSSPRPALLVAGGVGITPMVAMAREAVTEATARRHLRPLTVVHGVGTTDGQAFRAELSAIDRATQGRVRYVSVVSRPRPDERAGRDFHAAGRIGPDLLRGLLPDDAEVYLCGPPGFMAAIYSMLRELGVPDARIFSEAFGPASLERDGASVEVAEAAVVRFERSGFAQPWTPDDGTLLELAEAHGLQPDFGCRSGACGTCRVRLCSGNAVYPSPPGFPVEAGQVLLCRAVPGPSEEDLVLDL